MATIGTFRKIGNEMLGEIVMLNLQTKNARIVRDESVTSDNAPSHRIHVGRAEIGAGWEKTSAEGRTYVSVKLDDPSFAAPIYASLFYSEDGEEAEMIWSRQRKQKAD